MLGWGGGSVCADQWSVISDQWFVLFMFSWVWDCVWVWGRGLCGGWWWWRINYWLLDSNKVVTNKMKTVAVGFNIPRHVAVLERH